jgi:hypothetical protein
MRPVYVCALFVATLPGLVAAGSIDITPPTALSPNAALPDVTVVLDIKGSFSPVSLREMQKETAGIIGMSGIRLGWTTLDDASSGNFKDLVVMSFLGSCIVEAAPPLYDELGPYAFTRTANGAVQPFGQVDCDHVAGSVRTAMGPGDLSRADLLMGRALGRVVAHELVHMLTKSGQHAHEGVQKSALSGKQLISASLPLSAMDIDRLKMERGHIQP